MKALSIQQPWLWAIQHAGKWVENRTWKPPENIRNGERFALHASKSYDLDGAISIQIASSDLSVPDKQHVPLGAIVGAARISGPIIGPIQGEEEYEPPWLFGPYGWPIECRWLSKPIICRGALGFWELPPDAESLLRIDLEWVRKESA